MLSHMTAERTVTVRGTATILVMPDEAQLEVSCAVEVRFALAPSSS